MTLFTDDLMNRKLKFAILVMARAFMTVTTTGSSAWLIIPF